MPEPGRDVAGETAEVEDFGVGSEDGGDDPGITGHPPHRCGGQALPFGGAGGTQPVTQILFGQADDDGVPATTLAVAGFGVGGGMPGQLHQGLRPVGCRSIR